VLLTSYELREARFGKELIVNEEVTGALASQMEFIQERLKLSKATTEVGFVKKAVHCTVRISKGPFEKMIPYKLQVLIVFLNIIALVALSYFNSIHTIDSSVAIAIYTLILMISLEVFRLRTKGR
jgi:hypothetical protein